MGFSRVVLFDIKNIQRIDELFAHTSENKEYASEPLEDHLRLTYKYFNRLIDVNGLEATFKQLEKQFFKKEIVIDNWRNMIADAIFMHDIGKANTAFQDQKMDNSKFKNINWTDSKHAMLSAVYYVDYEIKKLIENTELDEKKQYKLAYFVIINAHCIARHHTDLSDFCNFKEKFLRRLEDFINKDDGFQLFLGKITLEYEFVKQLFEYIEEQQATQTDQALPYYLYGRLVYSLLVASDFYATFSYHARGEIQEFGRLDKNHTFCQSYFNTELYKNILKYKKYLKNEGEYPFTEINSINELRCQLFFETEEKLVENIDKTIFYLEAPTGSGKTNMSINLALKVNQMNPMINKIYYVFPYNNLVEQTKDSLYKLFDDKELRQKIAVINSLTAIKVDEDTEDDVKFEKALLDRQFLHYPIVITTHVSFFNILFGIKRGNLLALNHLANSVIILDEIQSYKNSIWKEIIEFLCMYGKLLNIKIIIMSATLPKMDSMLGETDKVCALVEQPEKYYKDKRFKDRVHIDYTLLDLGEIEIEQLLTVVNEQIKYRDKKIIIEFITKKSAIKFYEKLKENNLNINILLITGDDSTVQRKKTIKQVKETKGLVLVATQVVEAGVDIDMDIGFKNISLLDAEEQFLGRINRSCKKSGAVVYPFLMDCATVVYRNDHRTESCLTLLNSKMRDVLYAKQFSSYYNQVFERLEMRNKRQTDKNYYRFFSEQVNALNYKMVEKRMKLIEEDNQVTIFVNMMIEIEDGEKIIGRVIWEEFKKLINDLEMTYAKRTVLLSQIQEKMDYFTYKISNYNRSKITHTDQIGNMLYIEDVGEYMVDGRFMVNQLVEAECEFL